MFYSPAMFQMPGTGKVFFHAMLLQLLVSLFSRGSFMSCFSGQ